MGDPQPHRGLEAVTSGVLCRAGLFCGTGLLPVSWQPGDASGGGELPGGIAEVRAMWKHHLLKGGLGIVPPLQGLRLCLLQVLPFLSVPAQLPPCLCVLRAEFLL